MHTTPTPLRPDAQAGARTSARAEAFAAALSPAQRARLHQPYTPATLRAWSNLPEDVLGRGRHRPGLSTATLSADQWTALDALLAAATGSGPDTGLARIRAHLAADDHLRDLGGRYGYGRDRFTVAFLGRPAATGTWELRFGGHHLAVAHTYVDGTLAGATPSFRGIEPAAAFVQDGVRHEPERRSWDALRAVLAGLDADRKRAARLPGRHDDLLLGPGRDWSFPAHAGGVPGARLTQAQRDLLLAAIAGYVEDVDEVAAARILAGYRDELAATYLGWAGSTALTRPGDYVRVDGPSVWIELSVQAGIVTADPHPHAVWRDRSTDYGGTRF